MIIEINDDPTNRETTIIFKHDNGSVISFIHGDKYIKFPNHVELYRAGDLIGVIGIATDFEERTYNNE